MNFDSIILDIDGTIWNTTPIVAEAWNKAIKANYPTVPLVSAKILQGQFGKTMKVIADNLFTGLNENQKQILLEKCCDLEQKAIQENTTNITYDGVVETIEKLSKIVPIFIVSNCHDGYIQVVEEKNHIENFITDFECFGHNGLNKDENIREIIKRNNLNKPVYVGDTQGDFDACIKADVPFIWASYGFGKIDSDNPVSKKIFAGKIETFSQLSDFIK